MAGLPPPTQSLADSLISGTPFRSTQALHSPSTRNSGRRRHGGYDDVGMGNTLGRNDSLHRTPRSSSFRGPHQTHNNMTVGFAEPSPIPHTAATPMPLNRTGNGWARPVPLTSPRSPAAIQRDMSFDQLDVDYTTSDFDAVANTVTVFGFPPDKCWEITERFQQFGEIIQRIAPANGMGNWLHIRYKRSVDASRALRLNGKRLEPGLMIGVIPTESKLRELEEDFTDNTADITMVKEPMSRRDRHSHSIRKRRAYMTGRRSRRRKGAEIDDLILAPHRQNVCTRLMEYLFNW